MRRILNSSTLPADDRLQGIALARLRAHPRNSNVMSEDRLELLRANIERSRNYPPLVVRPHPTELDCFEVLDGHQRLAVLVAMGAGTALCYVWPCSDEDALLLLATLNRLEGADDPWRRAELLRELGEILPTEVLAELIPEDALAIEDALAMLALGDEQESSERPARGLSDTTMLSFMVPTADAERVLEAVSARAASLVGRNRRGRALADLCTEERRP